MLFLFIFISSDFPKGKIKAGRKRWAKLEVGSRELR